MSEHTTNDILPMQIALNCAEMAGSLDEVPVGCVIMQGNRIISLGMNQRESKKDATLHAEIMAIKQACENLGSWRLTDCELYVTLEPCLMCAGAIYQSRIKRVIYATPDPKSGAMGSLYQIHSDKRLNHQLIVKQGPFTQEASALLKNFFRKKRSKTPNTSPPPKA